MFIIECVTLMFFGIVVLKNVSTINSSPKIQGNRLLIACTCIAQRILQEIGAKQFSSTVIKSSSLKLHNSHPGCTCINQRTFQEIGVEGPYGVVTVVPG